MPDDSLRGTTGSSEPRAAAGGTVVVQRVTEAVRTVAAAKRPTPVFSERHDRSPRSDDEP